MIERLQHALEHLSELSPEAQHDLAQQIEDLTTPLDDLPEVPEGRDLSASGDTEALPPSVRVALALGGVWRDAQSDDEFAAFERIRHESR